MLNITLQHGFSVWTMLAVAVVAVGLAGWFYRRAFGALRPWQRWTLFGLRALAIGLVVLLLFRPVLSYTESLEERSALVVLLDTSASMSIADDPSGATRLDQARRQIEAWREKLDNLFDFHLVAFSDQARPVDDPRTLPTLAADSKATSLTAALRAGAAQAPAESIEALILLSDGQHNTASRPVDAAGSEGVVVHTVGVGATLRSDLTHRDIQLTGLDCPDRLMLNNRAKATASVEAIGLEGRVVQVVLEDDGQPIDHVELTLDNAEGSQTVEFEFRPTTPGRHIYSARVAPVSEEKITQNNQRAAVAIVVEPGIRVLYLEGTLRAEYGTLVDRFLAKDPDLEFCALVQTRPNVFLTRTNIEGLRLDNIPTDEATLDTFDVFILGDLDVSYLRPIQQELIVKRIRDGAGLVMLGGYHSLGPGGYEGTPLGAILPVRLGSREVGQVNEPFLPVLTPEGVRHPIFANIAEFFPTQAGPAAVPGLPPLEGCTRVEGPRAGATVLAKCPLDAEQPVVLAVQPVGAGRTAVFTGDTTRRWQQGPRAMGQDSPFLRFWGQMVRFLAGRQGDVAAEAGITGATDKAYYAPDEPVRVTATVRNDKGEAATEAEVVAEIFLIPEPTKHVPPVSEKNGGPRPVVAGQDDSVPTPGKLVSRNTLSAVPGPSGNYAGTFQPATPGTYQINLLARVGEKVLKAPRLDVEVGRPFLEYEKLDLNDRLLREIAEASGGRYVHLSTAEHLIDRLDQTVRQKQHHIERPLYWPPLVWPLFVGIVTLEWVLRRRFQLR